MQSPKVANLILTLHNRQKRSQHPLVKRIVLVEDHFAHYLKDKIKILVRRKIQFELKLYRLTKSMALNSNF